jgi:hypothetical protein
LLNGALLGSSGTLYIFAPQSGHFTPINLNVHGGAELAPRQIPHRPLIAVIGLQELATASGAFQFPVPALAPDP